MHMHAAWSRAEGTDERGCSDSPLCAAREHEAVLLGKLQVTAHAEVQLQAVRALSALQDHFVRAPVYLVDFAVYALPLQ